ncbi:MFS transporter [Microbacterium kyungheense]|uniref:MFS transporter n=1 Tax=Microbacterium kyungheense TaxID=1263636 RepID=A0A543FK27_9MICO|nr:MFS transporter [Microbacterium kyungheense]TQM34233.1 MFS transporter [Microbacterium kyungheense]
MSQYTDSSADAATAVSRRWLLLALLATAQLMLVIDVTVVALALPQMQAELDLSRSALTWVVSIYALMFGGFMLLGGKAADVFGSRTVVLLGLGVFTVASVVTGFAADPVALLAGRAIQGLGAAVLSPAALSVVARTFQGAELAKALGVWSAVGGMGAAVGVLLGGALTAGPGWSWVFWINAPVGAVLFVALVRTLPALPGWGGRLDWIGAVVVTASTAALILGLVNAGDAGWTSAATLIPVAAAALGYAAFVWRQRTAKHPLIDLRMLTRRPVVTGFGLIFVATALMIGVFFLGSFIFQRVHGFTALDTGLVFLPVALGAIAGAQLGGRAVTRLGVRVVGTSGLAITAAASVLAATTASMTVLVIGMSVAALGIGLAFVASATSVFSAVAPQEAGVGSGALSTFHEFGAATGVSAVSSIVAAGVAGESSSAYEDGFWLLAAFAAVATVLAVALLPGRTRSAAESE